MGSPAFGDAEPDVVYANLAGDMARNGAEQIGVVIALVGGLPWPRPAPAHCRTRPFFWPIRASS